MAGSVSATTIMAGAGLALSAAGTGMGIMGALNSANAQKSAADYQAQVAAGNAQLATQNANYTMASGEQQAAVQEQATRTKMGMIEAAQGSSGVDINSKTASALRSGTAEIGSLDAQTIRSNAARKAYGYQTQNTDFINQSNADIAAGKNAQTAGEMKAAGLLTGFAGSAATNYSNMIGNNSGLVGSLENPASSNYAAAQSYNAIDNYGAGSL